MVSGMFVVVRRHLSVKPLVLILLGLTFADIVRRRLVDVDRRFAPWQTGDWLINYQGGFVRRGLFGEIVFRLTGDGDAMVDLVTVTQIGLLAVIFVAVGWIVVMTDVNWTWVMVLFSPAWLLFGVNVSQAGLRKELLAFALLALLALAVRRHVAVPAAALLLPVFAFAVLSHEALVVFVPAIVVLVWHGAAVTTADRARSAITVAYVAVAAVALLLAARYSGDTQWVGICDSWRARDLPCDGGALEWLSRTRSENLSAVGDRFPDALRFVPLAMLASLPLWMTGLLSYRPRACAAVAASALPLFVAAIDYGRWIYIIAAQLSIIALALAPELQRRPQMIRVGPIWAIAFCTMWAMHHYETGIVDPLAVRWLTHAYDVVW